MHPTLTLFFGGCVAFGPSRPERLLSHTYRGREREIWINLEILITILTQHTLVCMMHKMNTHERMNPNTA